MSESIGEQQVKWLRRIAFAVIYMAAADTLILLVTVAYVFR